MDGGGGKLPDFWRLRRQEKEKPSPIQQLSSHSANIYNVWGCKWRRTHDLSFVYLYFSDDERRNNSALKASEARRDLHCVSSSTFCAEPMFNLERGISGKHNKVHIIFAAVRRYCCRCSSEERIVFEKTNGLWKQLEKMSSRFETLRCCLDLCVDTNAHMSFSKVNRKMLFGWTKRTWHVR